MNRKTRKTEPEIGTDRSSQTHAKPAGWQVRVQVRPARTQWVRFWTQLEPNRTIVVVWTRTSCRLPGPVANASSTVMQTVAVWPSINTFRQPGVSVINTASILCYMKVTFRTFKISWNTYVLKIFAKPGLMVDTLLILALPSFGSLWLLTMSMLWCSPNCWSRSRGIPILGVAFYTEAAHECTESQLYVMRHAWFVVPQCRPLDSGGLDGWLWLTSHQVITGSIPSWNSNDTAISKLKTMKKVLQMYV